MGNLIMFPGKKPNSFMLQVINVVSNVVENMNALLVQNWDNYTASLGVMLQPNSDYIVNIITQNSVGSSISGPFKISKSLKNNTALNRLIHCLFIIPRYTCSPGSCCHCQCTASVYYLRSS